MNFPFYKQLDHKDCGPTCLKIIAKHYQKEIDIDFLRQICETTRIGSNLSKIAEAAEKIGFRTLGVKIDLNKLSEAPLPCILYWNNNHFVVLYKITKKHFLVSDPAHGKLKYTKNEFLPKWIGHNASENISEGHVLMFETTPGFYNENVKKFDQNRISYFSYARTYIRKYKKFIYHLLVGLLVSSLIQLAVPFLTQSIVDIGIKQQDISIIYLILLAQLFLFLGKTSIEIIRGWLLLHLSTRINISLISDFFIKLMKLPISFFDSRIVGDIMQRIIDHKRIEKVLTTSSLNVIFSSFNLIIFGAVLAFYSFSIFYIFLISSILYILWVLLFFKRRRDLDYKNFSELSDEQSKIIEIINGMQEIKLHNAEMEKRWGWEYIQVKLYKIAIKSLKLEQYQNVGSSAISEVSNIIITVLAASLVIKGELTLGMMLAITYIVGQLNLPIRELINFLRESQDAKISFERILDIHKKQDEDNIDYKSKTYMPKDLNFVITDLSFRYPGSSTSIFDNLNLNIPSNKITAIVGVSGSGKTTLMKLFLKFYTIDQGTIEVSNMNLNSISQKTWRTNCGVVMQEGHIFNDTVINNIAIGNTNNIDKNRLEQAVDIANIKEFIESLPKSYNTKIGSEGVGLSTGQKQRILIARAVYKNPKLLCFDEATSALDANNEKMIMEKLDDFFKKRTVIVIAHRLSTVKNADQIVVLHNGNIVEVGKHEALINKKGHYYTLVKNQLELGK
jgi:ATP-binding cassette subfamily B protein